MSKPKHFKTAVGVANRTDPYAVLGSTRVENDHFWRWGDDNLFPQALALMARRSTTHRRIINDKADYISGKGVICDEARQPALAEFIGRVNGSGETLRQILNKLAYLGGQGLLLALGTAGVFDLIPLYIGACGLGLVYLWAKIRGEFRRVGLDWRLGIAECRRSISTGLSLMLSNVCSMLVLGVGRQVVDLRWGVLAFGQISFSLTLINFALTFISQISMVLFPALRRVSEGELAACCRKLEDGLYLLLPWIYVLYLPGRALLEAWLPEYRESLAYLALVLPICYFDCKMNLVGNTFLKVLNRQTSLLQINLATILVSLGFALAGAWAADNMLWVVCGMAAAIALRSIWAGRVLHRALGMSSPGYDRQDVVLAGVFVLAGQLLPWWGMMPLMNCLACGRILGWFARR